MFDTNLYRKDVLKPLLDDGEQRFDDPFAVFGLDPTSDDTPVIAARIDEVVAFWRKEQSSPRYKGLVSLLLRDREELSAQLLDPTRRAACRDRILEARAAGEQAKFAQLDEMLTTLERRLGGIPASRIERLRQAAERAGVTRSEFTARLADRRILQDQSASAAPLPAPVRHQARALLAELGRLQEGPQPVHPRTLFDFLGVAPDAAPGVLRQASDAIGARNRQRRHDRQRTVVDELLALVADHLLAAGPAGYVAGLEEDVADLLRPQIETAVLLEDRLTPVEFERLLRSAISAGLEPPVARSVLVRVATEAGAPIETGAVADYVVCAACTAACPADGTETCPTCGAGLFRDCPRCGRRSARSTPRCPGCDLDLRALGEAEGELSTVRSSLDDGHIMDARWRLEALEQWAGAIPEVADLRRRADAAHREVTELWARMLELEGQARFDDAAHHAGQLRQRGGDVPGPGGVTLDAVLGRIEASLQEVDRRVAAAMAMDGAAREAAVVAMAGELPASAAVLTALRSLPVAAPSRVVAVLGDGAVKVSWKATPSPGPVTYRVSRVVHEPSGATANHPVGSTSDAMLEDAGVPPGSSVSYEVEAVRHGIRSGRAGTAPLLAAFDVDRLVAIEHDGAIELRWSRLGGDATIWAERSDLSDTGAPYLRMRTGDAGVMDTNVRADHRYAYRVFVEYRFEGKVVATKGRQVTATAVVVPDAPSFAEITTSGTAIRLEPEPGGSSLVVVRCEAAPGVAAGEQVDTRRLRSLGRVLGIEAGAAADVADGPIRWYILAASFGTGAVVGEVAVHPGLRELSGLEVSEDGDAVVLRWEWPPGCTEAMVSWRAGVPPSSVADPAATSGKVTNMAYDLAGGWRLAEPPDGHLHFLVRPARRLDKGLITVPGGPPSARASLVLAPAASLSYRVRRAGRRKRQLEVELVGAAAGRPDLVVVGRPGAAAPRSAGDGTVLGTLPPGVRSVSTPLEPLELPMVVGVFVSGVNRARTRIEHPALPDRTIS